MPVRAGVALLVLSVLAVQPAANAASAATGGPRTAEAASPSGAEGAETPDASRFGGKAAAAVPSGEAEVPRFGARQQGTLPQPATMADPPAMSADRVDPARFGTRPVDAAYGAYQRGLYKTAYDLALVRARKGDPAAQTLVAEIEARGLGVPLNPQDAAKWYERASEQGVPAAQFQYALLQLDGKYVPKDEKSAFALMQAAAEAGNPLAQFNFAQLLVHQDPGDAGLARAAVYYRRAADAGVPDAQYAVAQMYANGVGGLPKDDARARLFLVKAARQNFDTAQLDLGEWMIEGRGGDRDYKSGFGWTKLAADGGNVAAQNRLAKLYMQGLGVEQDLVMAAAWYIVARRAGLIDPQMEDFMGGLDDAQTTKAIQKANRLP